MAPKSTLLRTGEATRTDETWLDGRADPYVDSVSGARPIRSVEGLLLAVLDDGIRSLFSGNRRIRIEAEAWMEDQRERGPFSFVGLCEHFRLDPLAARAALRDLRQRRLHLHGHIRPRGRRPGNLSTPSRAQMARELFATVALPARKTAHRRAGRIRR